MLDLMGMSTVDQAQPVNHHLTSHIFAKGSEVRLLGLAPTYDITDQATGTSRHISDRPRSVFTLACLDTQHGGQFALHYGDNMYIPDGIYIIKVTVNDEFAEWRDIVVEASAP